MTITLQELLARATDPLTLAIFAMGTVAMFVLSFSFRANQRSGASIDRPIPVILTILFANSILCHSMLSVLILHADEKIRLTPIEIGSLVAVSLLISAVTFLMANQTVRPWLRRLTGVWLSSAYFFLGGATILMATPAGSLAIDFAKLVPSAIAIIAISGFVHWKLYLEGDARTSVVGLLALMVLFAAAQWVLSANFAVETNELARMTHEGKNALWLKVFLAVMSVMSLGLCAVMGNNPRQHWRRYAVSAVLVGVMSGSIFVATHVSLRYSNTHFELARLVETLNAQRSILYLKAMDQDRKDSRRSTVKAVESDVFRNMQVYYDTSVQIDDLVRSSSVETDIRDTYLSLTFSTDELSSHSLQDDVDLFYEYLKSVFGLSSKIVTLSEVEQVRFERRLNAFSNLIISQARNASSYQILIKDMVLLGGVFIGAFLTFGVFLPAHRSTIQALDALESEKARIYKLALCAEHTTKGIVLTNARGQITWCNDAFCEMTGFRFSELDGRTILQATRNPAADQTELSRVFAELRAARTTDIEVLACRKDKSDFWLSGSITPIVESGSIKQIVHVFNDVTEAREMQDRLTAARTEAERLAVIARHATDGMAITDAGLNVTWVNPSFVNMTGYDLEDFQHESMISLLSGPESIQDDIDDLIASLKAREPHQAEMLTYRRNGEAHWVEAQHTPLFAENGDFLGFVIVHRDISERKALQLELIASRDDLAVRVEERTQTIVNQSLELEKALAAERELNRMQTEFVSMASHEFRTPLTIIDGVARRLEKRAERWTPDDIREKSASIRSTVKRMTMLVERTLDASRLSSGRIKLTPEPFCVHGLLKEICQRQREVAPSHKIHIDLDNLPENLFGDARLMDNVFSNVVSNAVKYSGERKEVFVNGSTDGGWAVVKVRDTGIGIPKDELPKIFQRFFRASTSTGIPGTGIGLNLVKSLVEMHHGRVELDSEEGEWTEFTIKLPLESPLETGVIQTAADMDETSDADRGAA